MQPLLISSIISSVIKPPVTIMVSGFVKAEIEQIV